MVIIYDYNLKERNKEKKEGGKSCFRGLNMLAGNFSLTDSSVKLGLPRWLGGNESTCNAGYSASISGLGRSLREGNGNSIQYSCLGNPMDRRVWWATIHGVAKELDTILWLNNNVKLKILKYINITTNSASIQLGHMLTFKKSLR